MKISIMMLVYLLINLLFFNSCQLEKGHDRLAQVKTDTTKMDNKNIELQLVKTLPGITGVNIFWNKKNNDWVLLGNNQLFWGNKTDLNAQTTFMNYFGGEGAFNPGSESFCTFDREVSLKNGDLIIMIKRPEEQMAMTEEDRKLPLFMENVYVPGFIQEITPEAALVNYEHRPLAGFDEDPYKGPNNLLILEQGASRKRQVLERFTETLEITALGASAEYYFAGNQNLFVWDRDLNKIEHELKPNYRSKIIAILNNETHVFLFRANGSAEIIEMGSWKLTGTQQILEDRPYSMCYSPELSMLTGTTRNHQLVFYLWNGNKFELFSTEEFETPVIMAKLSPDHQFLYLADEENLSIYRITFSN